MAAIKRAKSARTKFGGENQRVKNPIALKKVKLPSYKLLIICYKKHGAGKIVDMNYGDGGDDSPPPLREIGKWYRGYGKGDL